MAYRVELAPMVEAQLATMPRAARDAFDALLPRLAEDPWDFQPHSNPVGNMRQAVFGDRGQGLAVFLILDRDEYLNVIRVVWVQL